MQTNKIKRLFAFGCSFTNYFWATWPEILAYDLNIPLYNYGQSGAGNQYISNMVMQADNFYNFTSEDMVIIQWTNVCREDRYANGKWYTPGNIFSTSLFGKDYVENWADAFGYAVRDFATFKSVDSFLQSKGCDYHTVAMCDVVNRFDQYGFPISGQPNDVYKKLVLSYKPNLLKIKKDFYSLLWDDDLQNKFENDSKIIHYQYQDGHPSPLEHLIYVENVFWKVNPNTTHALQTIQQLWVEILKNNCSKRHYSLSNYTQEELEHLKKSTTLCSSQSIIKF
jgi:hypothetical protein